MKNRGISLFLVMIFLVSTFLFCTTAFAASTTQDGLTVELKTDKLEYAAGEEIDVSILIRNNGKTKVSNIRTELQVPEYLSLKSGAAVVDPCPQELHHHEVGRQQLRRQPDQ